jgi:hypothetical protein
MTRQGNLSVASSVNYAVTGLGVNPATASDFLGGALPTGTVNFAANESTATITINVVGDLTPEADERFTLTLSNPSSGTAISTVTATGTIIADDAGITLIQSGVNTAVAEGGATDTYTIVLNTQPAANVTITLNNDGQTTTNPASLTFTPANWDTAQTVTVSAIDDAVIERAHSGTITHAVTSSDTAYNGISIAPVTVAITDNDFPSVNLSVSSNAGNETGTTQITVTPTCSGITRSPEKSDSGRCRAPRFLKR